MSKLNPVEQEIVLASSSPYRRDLFNRLGIQYVTVSPDVDETPMPKESGPELAVRLAELKARTAAKTTRAPAIVIGSDQVAICDNKILGKPITHARAVEQLQHQSGNAVIFYTGIAVLNTGNSQILVDCVPCTVWFKHLTEAQIAAYLLRDQPYNCAGSFKFESLGIALLDRFEGSDPTAIIGLPLIRLSAMLAAHGVNILAPETE